MLLAVRLRNHDKLETTTTDVARLGLARLLSRCKQEVRRPIDPESDRIVIDWPRRVDPL